MTSGPIGGVQPVRGRDRRQRRRATPPPLRRSISNDSRAQALRREAVADEEHEHHDERDARGDARSRRTRSSGWYFTQSCCSNPTAMAPTNARGRLVIRPITTAANDPTSSSVNWNSWRPTIGASSTPAKPGEHDADHPRAGGDRLGVDARDPGIARVVDGHARREAERREPQHERRDDRDHHRAHDHDELVLVHVGAEHLEEVRVGRALDEALRVEDLVRGRTGRGSCVTAGTATQRPTVETRRTVGVAWVEPPEQREVEQRARAAARTTRIVNGAAVAMLQPFWRVR